MGIDTSHIVLIRDGTPVTVKGDYYLGIKVV
jgi:hypothetical protein